MSSGCGELQRGNAYPLKRGALRHRYEQRAAMMWAMAWWASVTVEA